jgi:hypothetical protein
MSFSDVDERLQLLGGAEQSAGVVVALERVLQHRVEFVRRQVGDVVVGEVADVFDRLAVGSLERGERPGVLAHQVERRLQVVAQRLAHRGSHRGVVGADERVQHQRDDAGRRVVAGAARAAR